MSQRSGDTWIGIPAAVLNSGHLEACLVHIYPSGPNMGKRFPLQGEPLVLGRGESSEIRVQDNSVSRSHCKLEPTKEGVYIVDTKSLNGTFVNDRLTRGAHLLNDGDYIRVGNAIFRFLTGGNIESEYHEEIYRLTIFDGLTQITTTATSPSSSTAKWPARSGTAGRSPCSCSTSTASSRSTIPTATSAAITSCAR